MNKLKQLYVLLSMITGRLYEGIRRGQGKQYFKIFIQLFGTQSRQFITAFYQQTESYGSLESVPLERLKSLTKGLHSLLPADSRFTFSILIPVHNPHLPFFKTALKAALNQTSPHLEILIGFIGPTSHPAYQHAEQEQQKQPHRLRLIHWDEGQPLAMQNQLAQEASGNYLLVMEQEDWMRPDLLFRYEQTLRLIENPANTLIYCQEMGLDMSGLLSLYQEDPKLDPLVFPYYFTNQLGHSLLIPKALWKQVKGLRPEFSSEAYYDLILRLDLAGAHFQYLPFPLYASRKKEGPKQSFEKGVQALENYVQAKKLQWKIEKGMVPATYRAIPALSHTPQIHVIIPFKDQKELTLKAVHSVLKQKGVKAHITAVDNNSHDLSIAGELEKLGVEVLRIQEPFNFSRLNNLAVQQTQQAKHCELLLFLNNDVELDEEALLEMSRWADQPHIGMVGCRLHYPNGQVQHGGIIRSRFGPREEMIWQHADINQTKDKLSRGGTPHVADGVTAACALMKRKTFEEVGGFDEIWYPVAYSDTNLAIKLKNRGLICFYTPYAEGVHHESQSRKYNNVEDFEKSTWLHSFFEK